MYNFQKNEESGIFLSLDESKWAFENKVLAKNSHKIYNEGLPLS